MVVTFAPDRSGRMQVTIAISDVDPPFVQTRMEIAPWKPAPAALEALTGTFYSDDVVTAWQILRRGDDLLLRQPARADATLVPTQRDLFAVDLRDGGNPIGIRFVRDAGRVVGFEVSDATPYEIVRRLRFDRIR